MKAVLDSVSTIYHWGEITKKTLFCLFIFLFFPVAWAEHFYLIPGTPAFHWIGFVFLVCLSFIALNQLEKNQILNGNFSSMVSEVYFFCLIGNVLIYSTAWILLGGPEFKFLSEYPAILYTLRA